MMIIREIREVLRNHADEKTRISGLRFFKEEIRLYGIKSATVTSLGKEYFKKLPSDEKDVVFEHCEQLWKSGYWEESLIACNWAYAVRKSFVPDDFPVFERWVDNYVGNWASCDTLCNHTIGTIVEKYPRLLPELKRWAISPNRWMLKVASQKHQEEVFEFILQRKNMMPRTALRYAIEKMPEELKRRAMEKG